jgi:3-phenylpropionate/trans-cinnamate dioxygenase ferredoxin reductase subunit
VPWACFAEGIVDSYRYVVVGGGLAGQRAAEGIRKVDSSGSIALICGEDQLPYRRPPLSKGYLTGEIALDRLYLKSESYYPQQGIELLRGARAEEVEPDRRRVTLSDGRVFAYEKLLLATGGRARRLPVPGCGLPGVFTLRTIEDADGIRRAARAGASALVVGGSFIGTEVASSLAGLGVTVTMVFMENRLLELVAPPQLSAFLRGKYEEHGVRVLPGTKPTSVEGNGLAARVQLDSGESVKVDLVVLGVGIEPESGLARGAGLELGPRGGVSVDEYLRTSSPAIYAAGDIAAWPRPSSGTRRRVAHWDVARQQGLRAGRNMAGDEEAYTALPYFFSDLFDLSFQVWGDLASWDRAVLRGSVQEGSFTFFYFDRGGMVGALSSGRPAPELALMPELVLAGRQLELEEVAARLQDEEADLAGLVG